MPDSFSITPADIDAVIGWTVIRAARQAARIVTAALQDHGLTPVEFGILSQLAAADGELTQAEVARAAEIRPQSAAPIIDSLCRRGLLRREGTRGRGRSGHLFLSEEGAALLERAFPDVLATNETFVPSAEQARVNDQLLKFLLRTRQPE